MIYNYSKLLGKIIEICGSRTNFAKEMSLSERSISKKLNQKVDFDQEEIEKAIKILGLERDDIPQYFFNLKVQND